MAMRGWRKGLAAALAALLLFALPGLAESGGMAIEDRLLSDLFDYLYAQEGLCDDALWAVSYFEQYDRGRDWDDLQIARAAACAAWEGISSRTLDAPLTTPDDYMELLLRGVDASFMETAASEFEAARTYLGNCTLNMTRHLMNDVFGSNSWETSVRHAGLVRDYAEASLQYYAYTADWLLLELGDEARTALFDDMLAEHCPSIDALRDRTLDAEALEAAADRTLGELESLFDDASELTGQMEADLAVFADAVEAGDPAAGVGEPIAIEGLPLPLPLTPWNPAENPDLYYYWNDADGSTHAATPGEAIDAPPEGCVMTTPGVTRESVEAYRDYLTGLGVSCADEADEDGALTLYYDFAGSVFVLKWQGDAASVFMLENPVCFAPEWYILTI